MKLLLVEDERDLGAMLQRGLRGMGYAVDWVRDGEAALYQYEIEAYDVIILDLNLPKLDGLEVLRQIRAQDVYTRILILSARARVDERVLGLDLGANDYLIKPFDFEELHARIRTQSRMQVSLSPSVLTCGEIRADTAARTVSVQGSIVSLTPKEYAVLEYLLLHQAEYTSAETLLAHIWDSEMDPFSSTVKYHISALKKKLGGNYIENIRGVGYRLKEGTP